MTKTKRQPTYTAFDGRIKFYTTYFSPLLYAESDRIVNELKEAPHQSEVLNTADFAMYMVLTQSIDFAFDGNEGPMLTDFKAWWQGREGHDLLEVWLGYVYLSSTVILEWRRGVTRALVPVYDPVTLPIELLKPEDAQEAIREDSPLESPA